MLVEASLQNKSIVFTRTFSAIQLSLLISLFFVVFCNVAFFGAVVDLLAPLSFRGMLFIANLSLVLWLFTATIISMIVVPYIARPILIVILIAAAAVAYFMNAYGVVIHRLMIQNVMETDTKEAQGLINFSLFIYVVLLGVLPSILLLKVNIMYSDFKRESWRRAKFILLAFAACIGLILSMSMDYASFFRNHKEVRQMANPLNFIYAGISYATASNATVEVLPIENDAVISPAGVKQAKPTLFVLVVGETARADHFGINGYERDTTPLLAKQNIINFPKVTSCGTETAVSVPCMFSALERKNYSDSKAKSQEGLLDVIHHAGIDVLWRDNNSSCKGTCNRVAYEEIQHLTVAGLCNERECFDEILLHNLDDKVFPVVGSKVIVLHPKGSHGPDYYNRYPADKVFFTPECKSNQLQNCSNAEVVNAFDNTIRYADYFLNSTIEWLKQKDSEYNTALIYLSDHGESLGENHLYLHGMPYSIAPDAQKQVPFFMWMSPSYESENGLDISCLKEVTANAYSHDNLFHTVLGMLNVQTSVYAADLDIVRPCKHLAD
jgi:lipid A ethanolaminephosphotransferase